MSAVTTGGYNTALGKDAGNTTTTSGFCVYLGAYARGASNVANEISIGYAATGKGTGTGYIAPGNGSQDMYNGANSSSWATTSDRRIKKNITDNKTGLDKLNQIRVRSFEYRTKDEIIADAPELTDCVDSAVVDQEGIQSW